MERLESLDRSFGVLFVLRDDASMWRTLGRQLHLVTLINLRGINPIHCAKFEATTEIR